MKKLFAAILCAALITLTAAGCGYSDPLEESKAQYETSATTVEKAEEKENINYADYEDTLEGLCKYFNELGYIQHKENNYTKMDASLIGAKEGRKYAVNKNLTIELYVYNTSNLDDTAKSIIDSVKKDGKFTILDLPSVTAYMSDNEKYLMIYTDNSIKKDNPDTEAANYKAREEVIEKFKGFYAQ